MSWFELKDYWHEIGESSASISSPGLVAGQVPYATSGDTIAGDPGLTYDPTTDTLSPVTVAARNVVVTALATPTITSPLVVNGTPGATTYGYKRVDYLADGTSTAASAEVTIATGNATLSATNSITVSWPALAGSVSTRLYRTTGGAAPPKLIYTGTATSFVDSGQAGTAQTPATGNTTGVVTAGALVYSGGATAGHVLTADANGRFTPQASGGGGGITNSAGANVLVKSDGTNVVATALSEASAGAFATSAGTALGFTATPPEATTGASQAGVGASITASPAVASTDTAGAAAGGNVTLTAGAAARNASGNASGGSVYAVGGAGIGTGGIGLLIPSAAGVSLYGLVSTAAGNFVAYQDSTSLRAGYIGNSGFVVSATGTASYNWSSTSAATGTIDVTVRRRGAANPAWGLAAASPVSYLHTMAADSRAGTDTNVRGGTARVGPGVGSGTGGSGDFVLQTAPPGSTGTAANTLSDRVVLASKPVTLTESSATAVLDVAVASASVAGGTLFYTIRSDDGTDLQSLSGSIPFAAVNKAGTLTVTVGTATESVATSSGTLTNTVTATTGTNSITLNLNAVSSLTQTTLYAYVSARLDGTGVATTK